MRGVRKEEREKERRKREGEGIDKRVAREKDQGGTEERGDKERGPEMREG